MKNSIAEKNFSMKDKVNNIKTKRPINTLLVAPETSSPTVKCELQLIPQKAGPFNLY